MHAYISFIYITYKLTDECTMLHDVAEKSQTNMHQNMHQDTHRICETMPSENTNSHHSVNLATASIINNLHGTGRSCKLLKRQREHNKVGLIVHELCMRGMPAEDHLVGRKVPPRAEAGATCGIEP